MLTRLQLEANQTVANYWVSAPITVAAAGTNANWLAQYANDDIHQAFEDIVNAGLTTVRTWKANSPSRRAMTLINLQGIQRRHDSQWYLLSKLGQW